MDYSSATDKPIAKAYDNIIENDPLGNFLVNYSVICFNKCSSKITEMPLNQREIDCLKDCYVKSFYSASMGNKLN